VFPIETRLDEERAARQPGTRVFVFFLDEFHVSPGASADRARKAVADFVDEKVYERDLAAVVRPLDPVSSVRFTRDRALVHGDLTGFQGRKEDYAPRTPLEERLVGRDPAIIRAARQQIVRASLSDLGERLGQLNADRAVMVLVSEGFPPDSAAAEGRTSHLRSLLRASSQFHFSIYAFNPAPAPENGLPGEHAEEPDDATLQWLATETGGLFVRAPAFIAGFARLFHDLEGCYTLTYRPAHADASFHPLEVRTRRGAHVRARTSYWAPPASDGHAPTSFGAANDRVERRSLRVSTLISAWIGVRRKSDGGASMVVTWEPRPAQSRAPHSVAIKARTVRGMAVFEGTTERVGEVSGSSKDSARFDVPAGRVEVDITVLDANGTVLDTDARDFDVPDLRLSTKARPVLLPTEIVRARTSRELRTASVDSDATPSPVRRFARGDQLLIRSSRIMPCRSMA
jgi:VWFA-related protein